MNPDMLSTFALEVARLSAFSSEVDKVAAGTGLLIGGGALGGAALLAGGQRILGDVSRGRRQRITNKRQRRMAKIQQRMQQGGGGY